MMKSRIWSRLLQNHHSLLQHSSFPIIPITATTRRNYCTSFFDLSPNARNAASERCLQDLTYQAQKERAREREERIKAGLDTTQIDNEEEIDWMGVDPLIEKLTKQDAKSVQKNEDLNRYEEATDSDSDDDDVDAQLKVFNQFENKFTKHENLLDKFTKAGTVNDAYQCMKKIDELEKKYFNPRLEYRVIGELMNRMKVAEGKERFLLQVKLNRALRMAEMREAFDPNNPANYGIIQDEQAGGGDMDEEDKEELAKRAGGKDGDESDIDDMKEKDTALLKKLGELDKELEKKLAELDHTFGKKGKLLEEEIRDLAEERNALTEEKRQPLYRKGFDVKLINVNRTCKVTKGGQVVKYTAMLACGNYHGTVGFAKAKGPAIPVALQKAHEKCFQNLHVIDRHEEHTIAHAIQTSYKKTKVYLWPAPTQTGMKAGRTVQIILQLAGFKNVKSKVVGSRNPHNTVKAVFKALNAIESPKDVADKFGRTVVESTLL